MYYALYAQLPYLGKMGMYRVIAGIYHSIIADMLVKNEGYIIEDMQTDMSPQTMEELD